MKYYTIKVVAARRSFDVAGHYSRPDIFTLNVNKAPQMSIRIREAE